MRRAADSARRSTVASRHDERLFETFTRLCEIRSPTGEEREIADTLAAELRALGYEVSEDDAAGPAEAGAGNLLARLPGERRTGAGRCSAPTSTPSRTRGGSRWSSDDGVFRSRRRDDPRRRQQGGGRGLHGAGGAPRRSAGAGRDRAAAHRRRGAGAARREGLRPGAAALAGRVRPRPRGAGRRGDRRRRRPRRRSSPTSTGSRPTPGCGPRTAAARSPPPRRRSARMELGRLDEGTTANVGLIKGGTSGNVVPGHCWIHAEARSLDSRARGGGGGADRRRLRLGRERARLRRRRADRRAVPRLPGCPATRPRSASPRRGCGRPGSSRGGWRSAAAATPTPSASTASTRPARQRHRRRPHRRRDGQPARPGARCSRSARGSSPRSARRTTAAARANRRTVSGRLELRRGVVVSAEPLVVEVAGERRRAWADETLLGEMRAGDEVVVNVAALELGPRQRRLRHRPRQPDPRPAGRRRRATPT